MAMMQLGQTGRIESSANGQADASDLGPGARQLRILAVDDDALNRDIMQVMLGPFGHQLEFACDGSEALEAIKTRSYDLVFMDLMLPDQSGRDVCRKVREWEAGKSHLPIVAVTAYDMPGQPLELFKAGMDDYIFKPYDARGLARIIELYAGSDGAGPAADNGHRAAGRGPEAPVLDWRGSLLDFSNDVEGYKELLTDFLTSLPGRLEKMRRALEDCDFERLNRECHSLKGVSAGLGALRLSRLATQLGRSCGAAQAELAAPLLVQVEQGIAELQAEGRVFLQS